MATNAGEPESGSQKTATHLVLPNPQPSQAISPSSCHGKKKCFTAGQQKITKTKDELTLASTAHKPQNVDLDIPKKLDAEVYLKPLTIREGQRCSLEVRVEVRIKGRLHLNTFINKSQRCHIIVITTVMEQKSGLVLSHYTNKQPFQMPQKDGYANYEWVLISHDELEKCSTEKVDICIELILEVKDWDKYESQEVDDDFVLINRS